MQTKQIQIAKVYKSGDFIGFGIAVDGALLDNQKEVKIEAGIDKLPIIHADFIISSEMMTLMIDIHLPDDVNEEK